MGLSRNSQPQKQLKQNIFPQPGVKFITAQVGQLGQVLDFDLFLTFNASPSCRGFRNKLPKGAGKKLEGATLT